MKYSVRMKSCVLIDAETPEEATEQVNDALEDAHKRNCGGIEDEILADAAIVRVTVESDDD